MRRFFILAFVSLVIILAGMVLIGFPALAARSYGPPTGRLTTLQVIQYSARLLWYDGLLTAPLDYSSSQVRSFMIQPGEPVSSVAIRLEQAGIIRDASALRDYLIYTGMDTSVQAGDYKFGPAMSIVDIAHKIQSAIPDHVTFVILPGWRMEEIAASLPTSGLMLTPEAFLATARTPDQTFDFLVGVSSTEGFFYPDSYVLPRSITADQLVEVLVRNFDLHVGTLREGFSQQGLSVSQAVILASLVQREAIHEDEQPVIASVFLNRLKAGMKLDADPTVQYALGYNPAEQTWWTNPLSLEDLQIDSPYNTYHHAGLPPAPIANPGLSALRAVAFPASTNYYFFRARCDGSGYHIFAETFEEQLQNACP